MMVEVMPHSICVLVKNTKRTDSYASMYTITTKSKLSGDIF